jgi:hypothetical protein
LGVYDFEGVSTEYAVYGRRPKVETIFAVSASLFCSYIGGCGKAHPIVMNLCFQFHDLPCARVPLDVYDAIDQILTGHEVEIFNEMSQSLVELLNRHHRGQL